MPWASPFVIAARNASTSAIGSLGGHGRIFGHAITPEMNTTSGKPESFFAEQYEAAEPRNHSRRSEAT